MCEIARNSVLQSGWENVIKKRWIGENCHISGPAGNDISKSNLPNIRAAFRHQTLMEERLMVLNALRDMQTDTSVESLSVADTSNYMEPMLSKSPKGYTTPQRVTCAKSYSLDLGQPAITIFSQSLETSNAFPAVSIITERKARGKTGHEEEHRDYSDIDDSYE
jgi:AMP deaminase